MFPDVKFIFYPLTHALAILVFFVCMRRWLEGIPHRNRYALWTAVLYIFCNGVMAKVFHFTFQASETPPLVEFLNHARRLKFCEVELSLADQPTDSPD